MPTTRHNTSTQAKILDFTFILWKTRPRSMVVSPLSGRLTTNWICWFSLGKGFLFSKVLPPFLCVQTQCVSAQKPKGYSSMKNAELQAVPRRYAVVRAVMSGRFPPFPVTVSYHKEAGSVSVQIGPSEKSFRFFYQMVWISIGFSGIWTFRSASWCQRFTVVFPIPKAMPISSQVRSSIYRYRRSS